MICDQFKNKKMKIIQEIKLVLMNYELQGLTLDESLDEILLLIDQQKRTTNIDPCPFTDTELIGLEEKPNHSAIWVNPYTVNNV